MKPKKRSYKRKTNISLRRRIGLGYARLMLLVKILAVLGIYIIFFTNYFNHTKQEVIQNIYELTSNIGFKLENVLVEGQNSVQTLDILSALNADKGTPIFSLNLEQIKNNLQHNSWIKTVVLVERRLPNTLYIRLVERVPIALWQINGQVFIIDEEGFKITKEISEFHNLLHIVGSDANIYTSQLIEDLAKYPELAKKIISAVRYGGRRWDLNFEQGLTVKMPDINFEQALDYLARLYEKNILFDQNYKVIDLRDSSKSYIEKY